MEAENKSLRAKTAKQTKVIDELKQVNADLKASQPPPSSSQATADPLSEPTAAPLPQATALAIIERQLAIMGATPTQAQSSTASLQDARNRQESELRHERNMTTLRGQIDEERQQPRHSWLFDPRDVGSSSSVQGSLWALHWLFIGSVLALF
jgi:hypothetical protein